MIFSPPDSAAQMHFHCRSRKFSEVPWNTKSPMFRSERAKAIWNFGYPTPVTLHANMKNYQTTYEMWMSLHGQICMLHSPLTSWALRMNSVLQPWWKNWSSSAYKKLYTGSANCSMKNNCMNYTNNDEFMQVTFSQAVLTTGWYWPHGRNNWALVFYLDCTASSQLNLKPW